MMEVGMGDDGGGDGGMVEVLGTVEVEMGRMEVMEIWR